MHEQGRPSWQLRTQEHCRLASHALRVRDLCGLPIPASVAHPPRIDAVDDVVASALSAEERAQAGALWAGWWRACLTAEYVRQLPDGPLVEGVWREDLNLALGAAGQAPEFAALTHRPALQRAAQLTWRADHDQHDQHEQHEQRARHGDGTDGGDRRDVDGARPRRRRRGQDATGSDDPRRSGSAARALAWQERSHEQWQQQWQTTSAVAQQVMATYAVPAPQVQAWLLQVPGSRPWWQLLRPGVVVATEGAAADVQVLQALLWEAFTSHLGPAGR